MQLRSHLHGYLDGYYATEERASVVRFDEGSLCDGIATETEVVTNSACLEVEVPPGRVRRLRHKQRYRRHQI